MRDPWQEDASLLRSADFADFKPSGLQSLEGFFENSPETLAGHQGSAEAPARRILVARKGDGKSILLAYKSYLLRKASTQRVIFHPSPGFNSVLVEPLTGIGGGLSYAHWLRSQGATEEWSQVWQIAIVGFALWKVDAIEEGGATYDKLFSDVLDRVASIAHPEAASDADQEVETTASPIQMFLATLMRRVPAGRNECRSALAEWLFDAMNLWWPKIVQALRNKKKDRLFLFIDNPDELISLEDADPWVGCQQGLIVAIWQIRKHSGGSEPIVIYASVRIEACWAHPHRHLRQALGLASTVTYDKSALAEMFLKRITLTGAEHLVNPELRETDPMKSFCGAIDYVHQDHKTAEGRPYRETILDACIRHSLMNPRDLIAMGRQIMELDVHDRSVENVKRVVNQAAQQTIVYLIENAFPRWDVSHSQYAKQLNKAVIPKAEIIELDKKWKLEKHGDRRYIPPPMAYFVDLGLLGTANHRPLIHDGFYEQSFSHSYHLERSERLPSIPDNSPWFFVHPAFKEWIRKNEQPIPWQQMEDVVIGQGKPFEAPKPYLSIEIQDRRPKILLDRGSRKYPLIPNDGKVTLGLSFLLLCLYGWKRRNGATMPTARDLNQVALELRKLVDVELPNTPVDDQSHADSKIRTMARYANELLENVFSNEGGSNRAPVRKPIRISVHAHKENTAAIDIENLAAGEIFIGMSARLNLDIRRRDA